MSNTIKLTGILTDVFQVEVFPDFTKKVFWLKEPDSERYPQHWSIELHQQDTERLKGIQLGYRLECECEVRGKKYKKRNTNEESIFVTLKCVGIRVVDKLITEPGRLGTYKPRTKEGRESDDDRFQPQQELPL